MEADPVPSQCVFQILNQCCQSVLGKDRAQPLHSKPKALDSLSNAIRHPVCFGAPGGARDDSKVCKVILFNNNTDNICFYFLLSVLWGFPEAIQYSRKLSQTICTL